MRTGGGRQPVLRLQSREEDGAAAAGNMAGYLLELRLQRFSHRGLRHGRERRHRVPEHIRLEVSERPPKAETLLRTLLHCDRRQALLRAARAGTVAAPTLAPRAIHRRSRRPGASTSADRAWHELLRDVAGESQIGDRGHDAAIVQL